MSELTIERHEYGNFRRQLLTTASAFALIGVLAAAGAEADDDAGRPTVWIELGGQLERIGNAEEHMAPPFAVRTPRPDFEKVSPLSLLKPPRYGVGGEGRISFEPSGTGWVFTAAVRYGRSNGKKHLHHQTYTPILAHNIFLPSFMITPDRFEDVKTDYKESHSVVDFSVGKDVGLGLFGNSVAAVGVRYAQFGTTSDVNLSSKPDYITKVGPLNKYYHGFHNYRAGAQAERNFHGVGPSLSLGGSSLLSGNDDGGVAFDWGVNAALLFGRQRTKTEHQTYGRYKMATANGAVVTYHTGPHTRSDSHSVTVPNLGGFAGLSMKYPNAKVSFGYRGDFFFGAVDDGIDVHKGESVSFHGPYARISVGL